MNKLKTLESSISEHGTMIETMSTVRTLLCSKFEFGTSVVTMNKVKILVLSISELGTRTMNKVKTLVSSTHIWLVTRTVTQSYHINTNRTRQLIILTTGQVWPLDCLPSCQGSED